jgi:hypothetical protein
LFHFRADGSGIAISHGVFGRCTSPTGRTLGKEYQPCGIIGLRRFSTSRAIRVAVSRCEFRGFSPRKLPQTKVGLPWTFVPSKPPAPFGWEGLPDPCRILTSPVDHTVRPRVFHSSKSRSTSPPKGRHRTRRISSVPCNPGLVQHSPFKACAFSAQNAFDWFEPHLSTRRCCSIKNRETLDIAAGTPLPLASASRLSR